MSVEADILLGCKVTDDAMRDVIASAFPFEEREESNQPGVSGWIEGRPVSFGHEAYAEEEVLDIKAAGCEQQLGQSIEDEVEIYMGVDDRIDEVLLAKLCIVVAEHWQGLIDLGGYPAGRRSPGLLTRLLHKSVDVEELERRTSLEAVGKLPGRLMEVKVLEWSSGETFRRVLCDAEFMKAWLNHRQFSLR